MTTIAQQIDNDLRTGSIADPQHWARSHFGLWIEGSYLGEAHYNSNLDRVRNATSSRKLRSFVIEQFTKFMAHEYDCSFGHAQKCVVAAFSEDTLENFTRILIADVLESFEEALEEVAA
jgi:hypothetical protein